MFNMGIFAGRLAADIDLRMTANDAPVTNLPVVTRSYNSSKKEPILQTIRVVVYGNSAPACVEHLGKGHGVLAYGRIQERKWEDKDGNKRTTWECVAQSVQFLGRPQSAAGTGLSDSSVMAIKAALDFALGVAAGTGNTEILDMVNKALGILKNAPAPGETGESQDDEPPIDEGEADAASAAETQATDGTDQEEPPPGEPDEPDPFV